MDSAILVDYFPIQAYMLAMLDETLYVHIPSEFGDKFQRLDTTHGAKKTIIPCLLHPLKA